MRRALTRRFVVAISLVLLLGVVGWAALVEQIVPDACTYPAPPSNAQYLHCP